MSRTRWLVPPLIAAVLGCVLAAAPEPKAAEPRPPPTRPTACSKVPAGLRRRARGRAAARRAPHERLLRRAAAGSSSPSRPASTSRPRNCSSSTPNSIKRLEDTDGDGRFDKATVFADKMTFPQGALWHDGALFTTAYPSVWRLEDADGDGVADRRTAIVGKFGSIGNAADLHGPQLGPDGMLYFGDGRNGHDIQAARRLRPQGPRRRRLPLPARRLAHRARLRRRHGQPRRGRLHPRRRTARRRQHRPQRPAPRRHPVRPGRRRLSLLRGDVSGISDAPAT